jgi:polyferredoxin
VGPVILDVACTNCGRCIDVCSKEVFVFGTRLRNTVPLAAGEDSVVQRHRAEFPRIIQLRKRMEVAP